MTHVFDSVSFINIKNLITLHGGSGGVSIERYSVKVISPSYCNGELSSKPS